MLVRSAHPLYGEAWSPGHLVVVLRRRVHDGGDQQLLEVLVGVDEKVVLPADSEVTTAAEPLFSRHCQYTIMNAESDSLQVSGGGGGGVRWGIENVLIISIICWCPAAAVLLCC